MKIKVNLQSMLLLLMSGFLFWLVYLSIFQASNPLRDPLVNEGEKKSALSLTPSIPTEYLPDGSLFWWITQEGMNLNYGNNLNEIVVGKIYISLSGNPCKTKSILTVNANSFESFDVLIEGETIQELIIPVKLDPYQEINIFFEPKKFQSCFVDNGDSRNFVSRMNGWYFE